MNPRDFFNANGLPLVTTHVSDGNPATLVPFNPDRYLLMFASGAANVTLTNDPSIVNSAECIELIPSTFIIFTHALHGALVNMEWFHLPTMIGEQVHITQGFIGASRNMLNERAEYAQRTAHQQRSPTNHRSKRNGKATKR